MNITFYKELAQGRWFTLSLAEQLANIGSEVGRAAFWEGKNKEHFKNAVVRALELFDLTLADVRWQGRLREIARARELFADIVLDGGQYKDTLKSLGQYFLPFTLVARKNLS